MAKRKNFDDSGSPDAQGRGDIRQSAETMQGGEPMGRAGERQGGEAERERIAQRAYELYLSRGGEDGRAEEDWLNAERELAEYRTRGDSND